MRLKHHDLNHGTPRLRHFLRNSYFSQNVDSKWKLESIGFWTKVLTTCQNLNLTFWGVSEFEKKFSFKQSRFELRYSMKTIKNAFLCSFAKHDIRAGNWRCVRLKRKSYNMSKFEIDIWNWVRIWKQMIRKVAFWIALLHENDFLQFYRLFKKKVLN